MNTTSFEISDQKLFDGRQYTVSHNMGFANGSTTSMLTENSADSGTELENTASSNDQVGMRLTCVEKPQ